MVKKNNERLAIKELKKALKKITHGKTQKEIDLHCEISRYEMTTGFIFPVQESQRIQDEIKEWVKTERSKAHKRIQKKYSVKIDLE